LPGHGGSPDRDSYALEEVAGLVRSAVEAAGLAAPVLVGHSIAAVIATVYAALFPVAGVVNVDQPLQTEPFARMLRAQRSVVTGPGFGAFWRILLENMGIEKLPPGGQDLVRSTSRPRQAVVLGYWQEVFSLTPEQLDAKMTAALAGVRAADCSYLTVTGTDGEPGYVEWLRRQVPAASTAELLGTGHFPHIGQPRQFAEVLAGTAGWACAEVERGAAPATR
ncbi:MAG: alpha/beta hydrolase, partial [Chloroflexi bacterium]|nr:alpha/beta hydrolase [Chloroflexota bacterium]